MEPSTISQGHVIYRAVDDDRVVAAVILGTAEQAERVAAEMTAQAVKDAVSGSSYSSSRAADLYHYVEGTTAVQRFYQPGDYPQAECGHVVPVGMEDYAVDVDHDCDALRRVKGGMVRCVAPGCGKAVWKHCGVHPHLVPLHEVGRREAAARAGTGYDAGGTNYLVGQAEPGER